MPRLKLLLNLGVPDCKKLGLDPKQALIGKYVDVDDDAAEDMVKRGWATDKPDETRPAPGAEPANSAGLPSGAHPAPGTAAPEGTAAGPTFPPAPAAPVTPTPPAHDPGKKGDRR